MRDVLTDLVRQTSGLFEVVKVTGTTQTTFIQGVDESKTLFVFATLKKSLDEFKGEFAVGNLPLLKGLLGFSSYKTDDATFLVKRETKPHAGETVSQFQFRDGNGVGSDFKTMAASRAGEQATLTDVTWDLTVVPTKAKMAEFSQLVSMFSEVGDKFGVQVVDGFLILTLGEESAATHSATMVFCENVVGDVGQSLRFKISQFLNVLKIAGTNPVTIRFTKRGLAGISVETETATYDYILRVAP